jgi:hypothetical protein
MYRRARAVNESEDASELEFLRSTVRSSGKSLASRLKTKNRKFGTLENWRVLQIETLLRILVETSSDLVTAYMRKRLATVAWLTRNLLELSIWIEYCTASEDNARCFSNDCLKDIIGTASSMEQLDLLKCRNARDFLLGNVGRVFDPIEAQKMINEANEAFETAAAQLTDTEPFIGEDVLLKMSSVVGQDSIRDNHSKVGDVARSLGRGEVFAKQNKLLSKFAHPTALLAHFHPGLAQQPLDWFLSDAALLSSQCIIWIAAFLVDVFPKEAKSDHPLQ